MGGEGGFGLQSVNCGSEVADVGPHWLLSPSQDLVKPSLRFEAADVGPHWPAAAAILRPGQVGPETINYINRDADCPDYD